MPTFGTPTVGVYTKQVSENDPKLGEKLDLTKNASFAMKPTDSMVMLCEAFKVNTSVKQLILRDLELGDGAMEALADMLAVNSTIEELDLTKNHISSEGVIRLADGIQKNKGLTTLNLLDQHVKMFGEATVMRFIDVFSENNTLTKIMWKVESKTTFELNKLLTRNLEIKHAREKGDSSKGPVPMFGTQTMGSLVKKVGENSEEITGVLDLTKNSSYAMKATDSTKSLCEALKTNTRIESLILKELEITDTAMESIVDMLVVNSTLTNLDLSNNHISSEGALALAKGLQKNKGLKTLNLEGKHAQVFGEECVMRYVDVFEDNITLTRLMWKVETKTSTRIAELLSRNMEIGRCIDAGKDYEHLLLKKSSTVEPAKPIETPAAEPVAETPAAEPVA